jgi:fido (protein-threonine AMPylation protein)
MTFRQKFVLNKISQSNGLSREGVQELVNVSYKVSKPTLIRDLNKLIDAKLIRVEGGGRNTRYFTYTNNPLLRQFDLDLYFEQEVDDRVGAKKNFDFGVFNNFKSLFDSVELRKIERVRKSFSQQTQKLDPNILKKEMERFVIELSWKSSKIEGNTYTLLETEELIRESKEAKGRTHEEAVMILNHKKAFGLILENKEGFRKISASLINQLHEVLVEDLGITAGIRKQAVGITGTIYRPLDNEHQITEAMERLIKVLNGELLALEKALIAGIMISYIQPYVDGNKRTARMLSNAILLAHDYYPLSYRSIDEGGYKKALIVFYEQGSLYQLKRFFIEQLVFAFKMYFKLV